LTSTKSFTKDNDIIIGDLVYKIPIIGIKEVSLNLAKKTKNLEFVVILDEEKQTKGLADAGLKPIKKLKRKFEFEDFEIARNFLAVLQRNFILINNDPFNIIDNVNPKEMPNLSITDNNNKNK